MVRLNLSRVLLRLNKPDEASRYRDLISADGGKNRPPHTRRDSPLRRSRSLASPAASAAAAYEHDVARRSNWLRSVSEHYISGLIHEKAGGPSNYREAWHHYNRLLSLARVKLDHRHAYICALLERRGAVLFEHRKLQCSMLSYLACLKILEHQQSAGSKVFNGADLSRVLYAVARVLHDKEEYHDALHMYRRALACQRAIAADSGRPLLDVITTLCNISRVHHLSGKIDAALAANREVLHLSLMLVGGKVRSKQDETSPSPSVRLALNLVDLCSFPICLFLFVFVWRRSASLRACIGRCTSARRAPSNARVSSPDGTRSVAGSGDWRFESRTISPSGDGEPENDRYRRRGADPRPQS